jgi:cytochrome c oxidase assembly protein subunit 15
MVAVGGLTRLTESGLSMTDWKPVTGWLPPIGEVQWQEEFQKYRTSPQYKLINHGMSLVEFQGIFWLEYIHRVLGRITGLFCLLPLCWFTLRSLAPKRYLAHFWLIALGVVFQGVIGWYMVRSGLKGDPYVSPIWLAFHLSTACFLLGYSVVVFLKLFYSSIRRSSWWLTRVFALLIAVVYVQIALGALVAGHNAGLVYNSFPTMNGQWIPDDLWHLSPWYENMLANIAMVQFQHRLLAYVVSFFILVLWGYLLYRKFLLTNAIKYAISLPLACVAVQFFLGVMTLLYHVPIILASLHQVGAIVLLMILFWSWYRVGIEKV